MSQHAVPSLPDLPLERIASVFDALALKADEAGWSAVPSTSGIKLSSVSHAVDDLVDVYTLAVYNEASPGVDALKLFPCVDAASATASVAAAQAAAQQGLIAPHLATKVSEVAKARLQGRVAPAIKTSVADVAGVVFRPVPMQKKKSSTATFSSLVPDRMKGHVKLSSCGGVRLSIGSMADVHDAKQWVDRAKQSSGISAADERAIATAAAEFFENMHYLSGYGAPARVVSEGHDVSWVLAKASCATVSPFQVRDALAARRDDLLRQIRAEAGSLPAVVYDKLSHRAAIAAGRRDLTELDTILAALELHEARLISDAEQGDAKTSSISAYFPSLSVFDEVYRPPAWSPTETASDVVFRRKVSASEVLEAGDVRFTEGELEAFCLLDLTALEGQLGEEVVQGLKKEPVAVFHSLPAPHKAIIAKAVQGTMQLKGDPTRQLESET
jgi:hypothetical protein